MTGAGKPSVLFVLPVLQPAGAERVVAELACRLPAQGFSTAVLCLEDERAPVGRSLSAKGVSVSGLHLSRRRTLCCARAIASWLPSSRPLIVHAHLYHANIAARLAYARLSPQAREGLYVLSTVHVAERRVRPWQFWIDRWTAKYARAEIFVSRAAEQFHRARAGLPGDFTRVIENGIDLSAFRPADPPLAQREPVVVSAGRLDPQKDYPTLLRAWRIVASSLPQARLKIAGAGAQLPALRRLAGQLSLERVEFLGFVEDVPALLQQAVVYVQSSAWEGFGLAVVEAMAAGLPVVASAVDSLPEIVAHGGCGMLVPPAKPAQLAQCILELLQNRKLASQLGQAARARACARYSVERMLAEYAALYGALLAGR